FVVEGLSVHQPTASVESKVLSDLPVVLDEGGDVVIAEVALTSSKASGVWVGGDGLVDGSVVGVVPDSLKDIIGARLAAEVVVVLLPAKLRTIANGMSPDGL